MKKISNNKLYYIRDSYIVEYEGADKKVRPYFCFSHSKNFALVFPITTKEGNVSSKYRRIPIPKNTWGGSKKSYLRIHDIMTVNRNTPYKYKYSVSKNFSDFIRQEIIKNKKVHKNIFKIKYKINKKEKFIENVYENVL